MNSTDIITINDKIESGIEGLDPLLFGGIPKGRAYLIAGEPGTGKTIFTLQYLIEGAKKGQKGLFVTIDEKPEHIISDIAALGWDITPYLMNGTLKILDVTQYFTESNNIASGKLNIDQIIDAIMEQVSINNIERLGIDPISPLVFKDLQLPTISDYIRKLIFSIEDYKKCTTLLTSYVPVGSQKISQHGIEEFAASGIIVLRLSKNNNKNIRTIWIRKMRGTRIDLSEYSFEVLHSRGIVLRQAI